MWVGFRVGALLGVMALVGLSVSGGEPSTPRAGNASAGRLVVTAGPGSAQPLAVARSAAWCGSGETPDNRLPQHDIVGASTIRVLYAYPSDVPSRFAELAGAIVADVSALDRWWRLQDPRRELRWDLYAFPGCDAGVDSLDLGALPLARESSQYTGATGFERLAGEIAAHLAPTEKALAFFDGSAIAEEVCGVSKMAPRNGGRYGISVVSLRSGCGVDLGAGAATARIAVHELVHNLGAVPRNAPNRCGDPSLGGHACDSPADLMFPYASPGMRLSDAILDVERDDYYDHGEDWWDVKDSAWLAHLPRRALTVSTKGPGSVSSDPAVVTCPPTCSATLEDGFRVRLTAVPQPGAEFYGWTGACSGERSCSVAVSRDVSVSAMFGSPRSRLTVRIAGSGRVTSTPAGIRCPGRCSGDFAPRSVVTLRAKPSPGWTLRRWSTPCGAKWSCVQQMTGDRRVSATFVRAGA